MKKLSLLLVVGLVFITLAAVIFKTFDNSQPGSTVVTEGCKPSNQSVAQSPHIINMDGNGFEPDKLTIKAGESVVFVNKDTQEHWPASDDHPSHQIYPEFDPKRGLCPGESWSFKFDRIGTWGMHDHLFSAFHGSITVQP